MQSECIVAVLSHAAATEGNKHLLPHLQKDMSPGLS